MSNSTSRNERTRAISLPRDVPVEFRAATPIKVLDFEERMIEVVAVPYDEQTKGPVRGPDGRLLQELIERGAFDGIDLGPDVPVNRDHDHARTIGKVVEFKPDDSRGLVALIRVSDTPLGDESLRLAADGVLKASVGMLVRKSDQHIDFRKGLRRIRKAFMDHLALLPNAAYAGAQVLSVRQEQIDGSEPQSVPTPNLDEVLELIEN